MPDYSVMYRGEKEKRSNENSKGTWGSAAEVRVCRDEAIVFDEYEAIIRTTVTWGSDRSLCGMGDMRKIIQCTWPLHVMSQILLSVCEYGYVIRSM